MNQALALIREDDITSIVSLLDWYETETDLVGEDLIDTITGEIFYCISQDDLERADQITVGTLRHVIRIIHTALPTC